MWPLQRISDEKYVECVRRRVALLARARGWCVVLYATLTVGFLCIVLRFGIFLAEFSRRDNPAVNAKAGILGLCVGAILSVVIGWCAVRLGDGLANALFGYRTERLLVHYHDALRAASSDAAGDEEHVERIRRRVAQFARVRRWCVPVLTVLGVFYVWLCIDFLESFLTPLFKDIPLFLGFGVGMVIGAGMGMSAFGLAHGLILMCFGYRSERLLVRYHDAPRAASSSAVENVGLQERR